MVYKQSLDNGLTGKPSIPGPQGRAGTQQRNGNNFRFSDGYGKGENEKGQITIAPGQVVRGGETIYDQQDYSRTFHGGSRWNKK